MCPGSSCTDSTRGHRGRRKAMKGARKREGERGKQKAHGSRICIRQSNLRLLYLIGCPPGYFQPQHGQVHAKVHFRISLLTFIQPFLLLLVPLFRPFFFPRRAFHPFFLFPFYSFSFVLHVPSRILLCSSVFPAVSTGSPVPPSRSPLTPVFLSLSLK